MSEQKDITIKDAIEITRNQLSNITIPAAYIEQIGIPVSTAIKNLTICLDVINKAEQERAVIAEEPEVMVTEEVTENVEAE